ncbi:MAG: hypothetical protein JSV56_10315 [Methanomassiliicoccales archaeon]|nr:MAG: hypothetical protein JSV56_10315 [Methanomassiliicoccales archaeon]
MAQIVNTSNPDEISAFLATTIVSHSYDVESTPMIVSIWNDLRKIVNVKEDTDFIATLLTTGSIMDFGIEIPDLNIVNTAIFDINRNMVMRNIESKDLQKELIFALVAAAIISRSEEAEKTKEIVSLWIRRKDTLVISDDLDVIAAILVTGRIMELKITAEGYETLQDAYGKIRERLKERVSKMAVTQKELTAAIITSANVGSSTKVEKVGDIVDTWLSVCDLISVEDHWDYISYILSTGRIRDIDSKILLGPDSLQNMKDEMKGELKKAVGD